MKYFKTQEEKISVIYEAPDERLFRVDDKVELDKVKKKYGIVKPYFLYVGQWRVHKNLVRLIKAFDLVRKNGVDAQLLLVGKEDPRYPEVKENIAQSAYGKDIVVTGYVPDSECNSIYSGAICFVFPSLYEGIGLPPLEAMNCGIPVISSDASCMPEILKDAVLYFDPYDIVEMSEAMERIAKDSVLREKLVIKGYELRKNYSWEKMARETMQIYQGVLR